MIKVIQNFMEITLCFNCFSEKTCWKMLFNILFSVSIFDTMFLFWFVGGCCLVAIAWSRIRLQMSTKKKSKFKLEELFSASSFGVCLYIKSDLHKILDNFYLNGFHIEEMTSYDTHPLCCVAQLASIIWKIVYFTMWKLQSRSATNIPA